MSSKKITSEFGSYTVETKKGEKKNFLKNKEYIFISNINIKIKPYELFTKKDIFLKEILKNTDKEGILIDIAEYSLLESILLNNKFVFVKSKDRSILFWREASRSKIRK